MSHIAYTCYMDVLHLHMRKDAYLLFGYLEPMRLLEAGGSAEPAVGSPGAGIAWQPNSSKGLGCC